MMPRAARLLVLTLLAAAGSARAENCPACTAAKECEPHAAADQAATKELEAGLKSPEPGARQQAVERFVGACRRHDNCRPPANAHALAAALREGHASAYAFAAEQLGASQDPKTAAQILGGEVAALLRLLAKKPSNDKEQIAWNDNQAKLKGAVLGLQATAAPEAGPAMAQVLGFDDIEILKLAANRCKEVRGRDVPPAVISALERVDRMPESPLQIAVINALVNSWEQLTASGIKNPIDNDTDMPMSRFIKEARAWWAKNGKSWK